MKKILFTITILILSYVSPAQSFLKKIKDKVNSTINQINKPANTPAQTAKDSTINKTQTNPSQKVDVSPNQANTNNQTNKEVLNHSNANDGLYLSGIHTIKGINGESYGLDNPIIYKNILYYRYYHKSQYYLVKCNNDKLQFADANDSLNFDTRSNGSSDNYKGYIGYPVVYKDKLYLCVDSSSHLLAFYDGNKISILKRTYQKDGLPIEYLGYPIVFNDKLYIKSVFNSGYGFAVFDGTTLMPTENSFMSFSVFGSNKMGGYKHFGRNILYNNSLYFTLFHHNPYSLCYLSGKSYTIVPFSSDCDECIYYNPLIVFNNKLYGVGMNVMKHPQGNQLTELNGSKLNFIETPAVLENNTYDEHEFIDDPIIFHEDLYLNWSGKLVKFDGRTISLIHSPQNTDENYLGSPYVFNNKLYLQVGSDRHSQLAVVDGSNYTLIENPRIDGRELIYAGSPIAFNNELYLKFEMDFQSPINGLLCKYDGNKIIPVARCSGAKPIICNNKLYFTGGAVYYIDADTK